MLSAISLISVLTLQAFSLDLTNSGQTRIYLGTLDGINPVVVTRAMQLPFNGKCTTYPLAHVAGGALAEDVVITMSTLGDAFESPAAVNSSTVWCLEGSSA